MALITKRRLASLASASAIIATVAVAAVPAATLAAAPSIKYFNGFENSSNTSEDKAIFDVTRVAGTKALPAASGKWYATAPTGGQVFTRQGGYSSTFPTRGYTTSVDIYLDVTKATGDKRFDWSSAVNKPDGTHKRDFIFHVGSYADEPGKFYVNASNNAPGDPRTGVDPFVPLEITKSGWYTFKHEFKNDGGVLAVEMNVIPRGGQSVATWTLRTETDAIGGELGEVGGNRYAWLVNNDFDGPRDRQHHAGPELGDQLRRGCEAQPQASGREEDRGLHAEARSSCVLRALLHTAAARTSARDCHGDCQRG